MAIEKTLSIIKPDAVERNLQESFIQRFKKEGFKILAKKEALLTKEEAQDFYIEHKGKVFYESLVNYMTSGPVVLMVLERENAILKNREVMGATNPKDAAPGTLRKEYAVSLEKNSVHGSDSPASAAREVEFFFPELVKCC
ncbi:MAG: nucleoside-diphosphate kinase [Deltaproteobacteria bacterium RIFCSPHIGHO2_02_FULL_40_11]|nr:MAG: nucleoside-diphosphate kinase [Deltaproteobacteria bacterium RIFCSPHIGHO2_02_FULL_40_11]